MFQWTVTIRNNQAATTKIIIQGKLVHSAFKRKIETLTWHLPMFLYTFHHWGKSLPCKLVGSRAHLRNLSLHMCSYLQYKHRHPQGRSYCHLRWVVYLWWSGCLCTLHPSIPLQCIRQPELGAFRDPLLAQSGCKENIVVRSSNKRYLEYQLNNF